MAEPLRKIEEQISIWQMLSNRTVLNFKNEIIQIAWGLLDKISFTNSVSILSNKTQVITILKKNTFLANYGYEITPDTNGTTIKYLKLAPSARRYFNSYVMNELFSQSALPEMTDELKKRLQNRSMKYL